MNCIYKINRYRMPLCIITEVTVMNTFFYVEFVFLFFEIIDDYVFVLNTLRKILRELSISDSHVILIDCEVECINAIESVFSNTKHALCLWHVNKNVLSNCKMCFEIDEV